GWLLLSCFSLLVKGISITDGIGRLISVLMNGVMMLVISTHVARSGGQVVRPLVTTYGLATVFALIVGLSRVSSFHEVLSGRFDAGMYNPNHASFVFAIATVVVLFLLLTSKDGIKRIPLAVMCLFLSFGVVLTGSRQGLVVLGAGIFVLLLHQGRLARTI